MRQSMKDHIEECIRNIREGFKSDDLHHGEVMYFTGYASALMNAGTIEVDEYGEMMRRRDEAHQQWKESRDEA